MWKIIDLSRTLHLLGHVFSGIFRVPMLNMESNFAERQFHFHSVVKRKFADASRGVESRHFPAATY